MAWIEVHQSLLTHRKTLRLCRLLKMDTFAVCGRLQALWCWALDNAPDGAIDWADLDSLPGVMGWKGSRDKLIDALIEADFLDRPDDGGTLRIHDWDDYAGKLIEQRKANAKRQRTWRESKKPATDDDSNALRNPLRNANITVTSPLRNGATVPNPTVPNSTVPITVTNSGAAGRAPHGANQQHAPREKEKGKEENLREKILANVPADTTAKYTSEEINRQFDRAQAWLEEHPTAHMASKFFADWLEREIKQGRWVPVNLSEIERLKRLREQKPDEKGLYHDGTESYTGYRLRQKIEELETVELVLQREARDLERRAAYESALHNGHEASMVLEHPSGQETPT